MARRNVSHKLPEEKLALVTMKALNCRFNVTQCNYSICSHPKIGVSSVVAAFPEYDIDISLDENKRTIFTFTRSPYQLITSNYTGVSVLNRDRAIKLLQGVTETETALRRMKHPSPLVAACEYIGITLRAYQDLTVWNEMTYYINSNCDAYTLEIMRKPEIPKSIATIKLGIHYDSIDVPVWHYVGTLAGEYTPEQQTQVAQELFREGARFDSATKEFTFDHYPTGLKVIGIGESML